MNRDNTYIYGLHAVESVLKRSPGDVRELWVDARRQDKRMAHILELAGSNNLKVSPVDKSELDDRVPEG
ncbi:RNA methyltransferase substrate-binding domain-containing protein, partial [Kaarinaea lacus]